MRMQSKTRCSVILAGDLIKGNMYRYETYADLRIGKHHDIAVHAAEMRQHFGVARKRYACHAER